MLLKRRKFRETPGLTHFNAFFARLKCSCSSSRKYTLFTCYRFYFPKGDVQFKQNEFHFHHLGKDLSRARPVMSDVSNCVRVTLILIIKGGSFEMQKTRNFAKK